MNIAPFAELVSKQASSQGSGQGSGQPLLNQCRECGDSINPQRYSLGYRVCLFCGEAMAHEERLRWCVAPMHKSNYMLITNRDDLLGINNKGGLVK